MTYKEEFVKFMVDSGVLTFGEFTLKSGRIASYFINAGNYKTGEQLAKLGEYYAECINDHNIEVETLFGPAYKGIPLSVAAAVALANNFDKDVTIVKTKYHRDGEEGTIAIVGPKRMEYDKVVGLLQYISENINDDEGKND